MATKQGLSTAKGYQKEVPFATNATYATKCTNLASSDNDIVNKAYLISMLELYGTKPAISSVNCDFSFLDWNNNSSPYESSGNKILYLCSGYSSENKASIVLLPAESENSVAEIKITQISGSTGYISFVFEKVYDDGHVIFNAFNISGGYIAPPNYTGGVATISKTATFQLYVKDIYGHEFTKTFTVNFKAQS